MFDYHYPALGADLGLADVKPLFYLNNRHDFSSQIDYSHHVVVSVGHSGYVLDAVYFQQNGFDPVDASTAAERQEYVFSRIVKNILQKEFSFSDKENARHFFYNLRQLFIDWNYKKWKTKEFSKQEDKINTLLRG